MNLELVMQPYSLKHGPNCHEVEFYWYHIETKLNLNVSNLALENRLAFICRYALLLVLIKIVFVSLKIYLDNVELALGVAIVEM